MNAIAHLEPGKNTFNLPDIFPRLAYENEYEALAYLERVFQMGEIREARTEFEDHMLAWLRVGTGVVMIGRANADVHRIHSPHTIGNTTVQMMVYVRDVDAHYTRLREYVVEWVKTPFDLPWGSRAMLFRDPDGNLIHMFMASRAHSKTRIGAKT